MNWFSGILVYAVIWWLVLFLVLPVAVKRQETPEPGHASGAPKKPYIGQKFLATTLISAILWLVVYFVITSGMIEFRTP